MFYKGLADDDRLLAEAQVEYAFATLAEDQFSLRGERTSLASIHPQYRDAIISLADRLGDDVWFLGSS